MAPPHIKQLDHSSGYLRWKESLLLRAHTLGVARVLFEDLPTRGDDAAAKKWARDDAVCRGHILAALSDRLLPDYARFATAADLWRAPTTWRRAGSGRTSSTSSASTKALQMSSWSRSRTRRLWALPQSSLMTMWPVRCAVSFHEP
uniref:Retrotransposon Copia-like N-terminal domain-containing protein n=1 Tax=Arundo donax TaxID=35708 RepID=A0A0A9FYF1_ARUDO